ncbi:MAG: glycosyltransferase family 2 protein [Bacteroidetes bacterium]|nr:glycosyltransferase family 2 protein [Bacteroidota bacterium]
MKFSILTPTYNRGNLLERAILSVLNQSYSNFEMIIIDDASIDNTNIIVSRYLFDKRIKYVKCSENAGVNKARNIGFENISLDTDFVTFLDSDDEFLQDALEKMKNQISDKPNIHCFRFGVQSINGSIVNNIEHCGKKANANYYIENLLNIGEWVCVFSKKIIDEGFRYNDQIRGFEMLAYIKLSFNYDMFFSNQIVRIYHTGHDSMMRQKMTTENINNAIMGYSILLQDYGKELKNTNKLNYGLLCYILGNFYLINNVSKANIYSGLKYTLKGFISNPLNVRFIRNNINLALSVLKIIFR